MQKIQIDNRDLTNVHIDTYQTFNGDNFVEYEIESLREEHKDDTINYDSFEWEYDHKAIVHALAQKSARLILGAVKGEYNNMVTAIDVVSSGSPKFYNYTTDYYVMSVTYNDKKLQRYINEHHAMILERANAYDRSIVDGFVSKESMDHAAICHFIDESVNGEDYQSDMFECQDEIYLEHTTITKIKK